MRLVALVVLAGSATGSVVAQTTPAPPEWNDKGASVYLSGSEKSPAPEDRAPSIAPANARPEQITTSRKFDPSIVPSAHVEQALPAEVGRHLAPPATRADSQSAGTSTSGTTGESRRPIDFGVPTKSLYTMGTGLAIAVGAFLLFAWVLRRAGRGRIGRGILPAEAVSVLGRVSLSSKQAAQLLKVGNKLILVALTPGGAETLTEITDPVEVDRLMGLCQQDDRYSTTKAFEEVFQNLSREPALTGFLGGESLPNSISPVAAAYRSHRGDGGRV